MSHELHTIVLTGGPCGGKTSCKAFLTERLEAEGYRVFHVPEVATLLSEGGAPPTGFLDEMQKYEFSYLKVQMELEQAFMDIAYLTGEPSVVICDRGTVDAAVYLKDYEWTEIMETMWWSDEFISHNRYDLVLHLVTAAIGAEAFYTTENNEARTETLEEARALDHKFREVWADHPNRLIIDNEGNFEDKLEQMWEGLQVLLQSQDDE